ncbi:MAG: hypothetical protein B7Z32_06900 [Hydrogenophilales bacterium 12-64-13]|nr:MAG: hypothetical protein B7Z32_06900 [Hydrogenophilales bacterium 12-64-13]OZA38478.1 MAG: hypothetical protein B7X87_08305 [Hydrogenophilales bacterium 17-64-34]HQT00127.1 DsrE family protein [Thiobacillus sp.]
MTSRTLASLALAFCLATPLTHAAPADAAAPEDVEKVVYHVNDTAVARVALNNVNNHLSANPDAKIVVVTHGKGIDFLLKGAEDSNGNPYEIGVQSLKAKGVDFRVCNNTLRSRKLDASAVVEEATVVPSGVAEIGKLQAKEGYVYLKP